MALAARATRAGAPALAAGNMAGLDWTPAQRKLRGGSTKQHAPACAMSMRWAPRWSRPGTSPASARRNRRISPAGVSLRRETIGAGLLSRAPPRPSSLKTRQCDGDHYIINGTTKIDHARPSRRQPHVRAGAHQREDRAAAGRHLLHPDRHEDAGITTRPILTIGGDHEVNQVFLTTSACPSPTASARKARGWTYDKYLLEFERGAGIAFGQLREALTTFPDLARSDVTGHAIDDPGHRDADVRGRGLYRCARDDRAARAGLRCKTGQNPGAVFHRC